MSKDSLETTMSNLRQLIGMGETLINMLPTIAVDTVEKELKPKDSRVGRVAVTTNGQPDLEIDFYRADATDIGEAVQEALAYRDRMLREDPSHKVTIKIKGAK